MGLGMNPCESFGRGYRLWQPSHNLRHPRTSSALGTPADEWLVLSSTADLLIISTLAIHGIAMAPLSASLVAGEDCSGNRFLLILDVVKIPVFARLGLTSANA